MRIENDQQANIIISLKGIDIIIGNKKIFSPKMKLYIAS